LDSIGFDWIRLDSIGFERFHLKCTRQQFFVGFLLFCLAVNGVARWFLFKPKIKIWANFGGP
jgi:hypothetical protein